MTLTHIDTLKGTLKTHSLKALVATVAMMMLTGAKAESCGGGGEEPPPPPEPCGPGFHLETVCNDCALSDREAGIDGDVVDCGGGCEDICVPNSTCPDGTYEEWICDPMPLSDSMPCYDGDVDCGPPEPNCYLACTPADSCGEGFHEEWECYGVVEPDPGFDSGSEPMPPQEEECFLTCVPDFCPPGTIEQTVCAGAVPVDDPSEPASIPGEEPPLVEECWTECIPDVVCPAGQHPEEVCTYCMEPTCEILCVDDYVSEPSEPQAS